MLHLDIFDYTLILHILNIHIDYLYRRSTQKSTINIREILSILSKLCKSVKTNRFKTLLQPELITNKYTRIVKNNDTCRVHTNVFLVIFVVLPELGGALP